MNSNEIIPCVECGEQTIAARPTCNLCQADKALTKPLVDAWEMKLQEDGSLLLTRGNGNVLRFVPASLEPYGWLTGDSSSHRNGTLEDLTTNYQWAKEIVDANNAEERKIDPAWVDEAPVPLYKLLTKE